MIEKTLYYRDPASGTEGRVLVTYRDDPDTNLALSNDIIVSYYEADGAAGWWVTFVGRNGERGSWPEPVGTTVDEVVESLKAAGLIVESTR